MEKWQFKAKRLFREKGISHERVGQKLGGLKKAVMSLKLNAHTACNDQEMIIIANMLDMTLDELVSEDPLYTSESTEQKKATQNFYQGYKNLKDKQKTTISKWLEKGNERNDALKEFELVQEIELEQFKDKQAIDD